MGNRYVGLVRGSSGRQGESRLALEAGSPCVLSLCTVLTGFVLSLPAHGGFQALPDLNQVVNWQGPPDGVSISSPRNGFLVLTVSNLKEKESRVVRLAKPVQLAHADAFNYWVCFPAAQEEHGMSLTPLFADGSGREIRGGSDDFVCSHIGAPNDRRSGLWYHDTLQPDPGALSFIGFSVTVTYIGNKALPLSPHAIYLKDFGLEHTDYASIPLYYMVGNYRDNFCVTSFNGAHARAMTSENSGENAPFVLLDNLLDQSKLGRPKRITIRYYVYDMQDRLVHVGSRGGLAVATPADFFVKLPVPVTAPGSYNIKGKTFDAATGEYITTDWAKLIVIKGADKALKPVRFPDLLAVNPDKPHGRYGKADKREIAFQIGPVKALGGPVELRYSVVPYSTWVPRWNPVRNVALDHVVPVTGIGSLTASYEPKRTVELVVAELWQRKRRLDREERLIGVVNGLDQTPVFTNRAQVPSFKDVLGPDRIWMNSTFQTAPGEDVLGALARNIDEAKKLTPNLGFTLDMDRVEPMPGVYDWDYLTPFFDLAARKGCRLLQYMNLKWPVGWAPVEFQLDENGCAHRLGNMYGYMAGKYLYFNGAHSPEIRRDFVTQFARRYLNHPGLLGYYFENEHADTKWMAQPISLSYHEAYRKQFSDFVAARHGDIGKLNKAYGMNYNDFGQVQLPRTTQHARKVALADFLLFRRQATENAVLRDEVDAARTVDPQRPIVVYGLSSAESDGFLRQLVARNCMMANGGIHSDITAAYEYERYNSICGLRYRMEPHDVWNYDPIPCGFDEMIFGMLGMGGRGLGFHFFLPGRESFSFEKAMKPGQPTGYDKVVKYQSVMRELSAAEKQHDPIGILELHNQAVFGDPWGNGIWNQHCSLYVRQHYCTRIAAPEIDPAYLMESKIIFAGGEIVSTRQTDFLNAYLQKGGRLVMLETTGKYRLEDPDNAQAALAPALGIAGTNGVAGLPDLQASHTRYQVDKGQVLILRGQNPSIDQWTAITPALLRWSSATGRLADSADPDMQIHVMRRDQTFYMATTHRNQLGGPEKWSGTVRWCALLPAGNYRITELMSGMDKGLFTPEQMATGFDAGAYGNLQMKIFRIALPVH